jgi:hypothetical protein
MLNILGHEVNENQNNIEFPLQNSYHQELKQQQMLPWMWKKKTYPLLMGM